MQLCTNILYRIACELNFVQVRTCYIYYAPINLYDVFNSLRML